MPERRTPFYDFHRRSARNMVKGGGDFMFPTSYASSLEEHLNVRRNVGMQDLSTMGEVDIKGPGAERLVRRLLVNEVQDMEPGQLRYAPEGLPLDLRSRRRLQRLRYRPDGGHRPARGPGPAFAWLSQDRGRGRGPRRAEVLPVRAVPHRGHGANHLALGLHGRARLRALHASGSGLRAMGASPAGGPQLQPEALRSRGHAVPAHREEPPFHVGLGRWVRFDKREFVGREALLRVQESGLDRRWVGLTLESEVPAAAGAGVYGIADVATFRDVVETGAEAGEQEDELMPGEQQVGRVTSSAMGHTVGRMLAMAYVDTAHSWPGNNLVVELGGRPIPARVAQTPFFDPEFARVRARPNEDDRLSELVPEPARLTNARVPASQSPNGNTRR